MLITNGRFPFRKTSTNGCEHANSVFGTEAAPRRIMCRRLWPILLIVMSPLRSEAASRPEIPFQVHDGLIWIDVRIGQNPETYRFLLDSGANGSVVDLGVARKIG